MVLLSGAVIYCGDYARKCYFATVVPELIILSLECRFRYRDFNLTNIIIAIFKYSLEAFYESTVKRGIECRFILSFRNLLRINKIYKKSEMIL